MSPSLPNIAQAVISREKLEGYILNVEHRRGGHKARLLAQFGYTADNWRRLEYDIRRCIMDAEIETTRATMYGTRYEIVGLLNTPNGRDLRVRTVWQTDAGTNVPRLITLYPG